MKNKEKYKNELIKILSDHIAIDKDTGEPRDCHNVNCRKCVFEFKDCNNDNFEKTDIVNEWLEKEYVESFDWSKVHIDTPIIVSNDEKWWHNRHFAKYENGNVYAFDVGKTSWSVVNFDDCAPWQYAKIAESEGEHEVN